MNQSPVQLTRLLITLNRLLWERTLSEIIVIQFHKRTLGRVIKQRLGAECRLKIRSIISIELLLSFKAIGFLAS